MVNVDRVETKEMRMMKNFFNVTELGIVHNLLKTCRCAPENTSE